MGQPNIEDDITYRSRQIIEGGMFEDFVYMQLEEKLKGADGQQKAGALVVGKIKKEVPGRNRPITDEEKWVFYIMPPNEWMPKE